LIKGEAGAGEQCVMDAPDSDVTPERSLERLLDLTPIRANADERRDKPEQHNGGYSEEGIFERAANVACSNRWALPARAHPGSADPLVNLNRPISA
jgi:hypothetical protein